jgi:uncharacterized Zn-binding protein involved in type VI secretion
MKGSPMSATAKVLSKAQQLGKPGSSITDGWNRSWAEAKKRLDTYDPNAPNPVVASTEALGRGMAGDWHSSSQAGVEKAMAQQAKVLGQQFQSLNPFSDAKAPPGVLGKVGAAFGMLTTAEQIITAPLAMIPSPALPAVRVFDFDIGLPHGHPHPPNTPPAPPIPLPSTGPVIPIPILSGANSVLINGMPAARCGDMGLGIWCGGYFPFYEIFLGSSTVWLEGARAARLAVDVTKHCTFSNPKPADAPIGPMFGFTITASSDVMIGGLPMPSLSAKAMAFGFKALFKLFGKAFGMLKGLAGKGKPKAAGFGKLPDIRGPKRGPKARMDGDCLKAGKADFMTPDNFRAGIDLIRDMKRGKQLFVHGDDAFVKAAERDLHIIASSNTGRRALEEIRASGQKLVLGQGGPHCDPFHGWGAQKGVGSGSGSIVKYEPGKWYGPHTPPDVVLLHELGHASHASRGQMRSAEKFADAADNKRWSTPEEVQTVNGYENPYRNERGLNGRTGHDDFP